MSLGWWSYYTDDTEPLIFADFHVDGSAFLRDWINYVVLPNLSGETRARNVRTVPSALTASGKE